MNGEKYQEETNLQLFFKMMRGRSVESTLDPDAYLNHLNNLRQEQLKKDGEAIFRKKKA